MPVQKWQLGLGAGVLALGVAGAIGYTALNSKPAPAPAPPPMAAATPAPAPAPVKIAPTDDDPVAEFAATTDAMVVTTSSAAYLAPNINAPQFYPLKVGTPIQGSEKSTDGKWLLALTADGQAAFIPTSTLGPYDPSAPTPAAPTDASASAGTGAPAVAALPSVASNVIDSISGKAKVIDTATLMVGVQRVSLAGIDGATGDDAKRLQELIDSKGGNVDCHRQTAKYVCQLAGVGDIARAALYNGAARPASNASDDYRQQADDAKAAHRGLWANKS